MSGPACGGKDALNPGEKLGVFHVTAQLATTSCGPTPNPWEFDVRLNHEGSTIYWIQGGAPINGQVSAQAKTELSAQTTTTLREQDVKRRLPACSVIRLDTMSMALADEANQPAVDPSATKSFTGSLSYVFTPTDGSVCDDQLLSTGGDFERLPCEVRYEIAGTYKSATP